MPTENRHKQERATSNQSIDRSRTEENRGAPIRRDWERSQHSPFNLVRQGLDEMDRWFGQLGWGRSWLSSGRTPFSGERLGDWSPAVEAFQRGNEFVIRAEVPGMNRQDLHVEIGDDTVTIQGERKQDKQEERDGVFWTERSYGSFTRVVPLPTGAITESAKASFSNGVLEVVMQAPSAETRRGRRLDIGG